MVDVQKKNFAAHRAKIVGLQLTTSVVGLDSFVREQTTPADPEAEVRLSFLGHALPQVTLFKVNAPVCVIRLFG